MRFFLETFVAGGICFCTTILSAEEQPSFPEVSDSQKETIPLLKPQEALERVKLPSGFQATLFAGEPNVRQPIAMAFDARGRLWVAENYTYSEAAINFDSKLRDRILIFEDKDGDGRFDKRTVFCDQAERLTSIAIGFGGVFATCPPYFLFIPDRDGNDAPDAAPEVLLDGFDYDKVRHTLANGLKFGPDGWLYGRHGIQATSLVGKPGTGREDRTRVNGCIWRYHPTRRIIELVAQRTTNPWGSDWDEYGGIEAPVEVVERFQVAEVRQLGVAFHLPLLPDVEFVLTDEFEELGMAEPVGGGFLQPHIERLEQAGEAELFQGGLEGVHV